MTGAVLAGLLGPVWLGVGPALVALVFLVGGSLQHREVAARGTLSSRTYDVGVERLLDATEGWGQTGSRSSLRRLEFGRSLEVRGAGKVETPTKFQSKLEDLIALALRYKLTFAVIAVRPHNLSELRQRIGDDAAGLLAILADRATSLVRDVDSVTTMGLDAVVIAAPMQDAVGAMEIGARLSSELEVEGPEGVPVPLTFGVSEGPLPDAGARAYIAAAIQGATAAVAGQMVVVRRADLHDALTSLGFGE